MRRTYMRKKRKPLSKEHRVKIRAQFHKERLKELSDFAKTYSSSIGFIKRRNKMELAQCSTGPVGVGYEQPSITARLKGQKENLEKQLAKVNEALGLIESNPEFQKIFDAISRVNY